MFQTRAIQYKAIFLLLIILTGCAPGTPSNPDLSQTDVTAARVQPSVEPGKPSGDEQVTISFAATTSTMPVYQRLAQSFRAEHPGITVVIIPLDDLMNPPNSDQPDTPLDLARRIVSGADTAPADLMPSEALGTSLLSNLAPLMDADVSFQRDDFYPGALERFTTPSGTWVLPRFFSIPLLFYNKNLFKQAGVAEPRPDWTWNDLVVTAQQLARKNGTAVETYGFFDNSSGLIPLLSDLESRKIDLLSTPLDKIQFSSPEMLAAVKNIRGLQESGALFAASYGGSEAQTSPSQLVRDGRIGIWVPEALLLGSDAAGGSANLSQQLPFGVGTVPYPYPRTMGSMGLNGGYVISGGTAHPNEAWKWIEFLSRQPIDTQGSSDSPEQVPARRTLADATGFWQRIGAEQAAAYQWALQHRPTQAPSGSLADANLVLTWFTRLYSFPLLQNPEDDPTKLLAEAQQAFQEMLAAMRQSPTPDLGQVVVATPEPDEAPAGTTAITFGAWDNSPIELRQLARAFREQHPDIFVKVSPPNGTTGSAALKEAARTSDCFSWSEEPESVDDFGTLLDLRPLMDADTSFARDDIPAVLYSPYERNGGTYGLPYAFSMRSLGYNRAALDTAGIRPQTATWTPEDFLSAAQALTRGEGKQKQYGYAPLGDASADLLFFIDQFGGRLSTGSAENLRPNFTDPKVVQAIQWYLDLSKVHKVAPPLKLPYRRGDDSRGLPDLVLAGRVGLWLNHTLISFSGSAEYGLAPLPVGSGLRSSDLNVRGFHISASTQHQQECWAWIRFLSGDLTDIHNDIPARSSLALSEDYARSAEAGVVDLYKSYGDTFKHADVPDNNLSEVKQRFDLYWFFQAITQSYEKNKDLSTELAEAQRLTSAYVECMVKEHQQKPVTCAQHADPTYQGFQTADRTDGQQ